ncbi:hypothetical protein MCUN1_000477 [Malassezia cuniculi]|uniref:Small ribosomal subunit protein bS18m n=1 Tax=Malassezia cuniculi TaxID=948313 RepID=A0AAF0ERF3_9BASI|nr:hypothetical protein MCUN1_000477 [Malassezia cuniculi]
MLARVALRPVAAAAAGRAPVRMFGTSMPYLRNERPAPKKDNEQADSNIEHLASFLESQPTPNQRNSNNRNNARNADTRAPGPTKTFANGHYYDPYTLSPEAMTNQFRRRAPPLLGPSKREAMKSDPIHILGLKPSKPSLADDSYKNGALLSEYISEMGRILPRNLTGLTRKSQRSIGKAIRRARAFGILPVHTRSNGNRGAGGWR